MDHCFLCDRICWIVTTHENCKIKHPQNFHIHIWYSTVLNVYFTFFAVTVLKNYTYMVIPLVSDNNNIIAIYGYNL